MYAFNFSPLRIMFAVGLSYIAFIMLRYVPSIPAFWRDFIINGCWILSKAFSTSIEIIKPISYNQVIGEAERLLCPRGPLRVLAQFHKLSIIRYLGTRDIKYNMTNIVNIQFSHSVMSNSLRPHELQHTRPPCPSPTPRVYLNLCPWVGDAIQPSHLLSSPSPPTLNLS